MNRARFTTTAMLAAALAAGAFGGAIFSGAVSAFEAAESTEDGLPYVLPYEGSFRTDGARVTGTHQMRFSIYTSPDGGASIWGSDTRSVEVADGIFSVVLGDPNDTTPLPQTLAGEGQLWIELSVDGVTLSPRQRVAPATQALYSSFADRTRSADNGVPPGTVAPFAGRAVNVPDGWLLCDGAGLSSSDYPDLFGAIEATWGDGTNGCDIASCDFNVPDMRGMFLRGADDRTSAAGAPDREAPRAVGSQQQWSTSLRRGVGISVNSSGNHNHSMGTGGADSGTMSPGGATQRLSHFRNDQYNAGGKKSTDPAGVHTHGLSISSAEETAPVNKAVSYIIKY